MRMHCSPLERIGSSPYGGELFFKREDLYSYGGGNKVRRFISFFAKRPGLKRAAVLSNPGAHTFYSLYKLLAGGYEHCPPELLFFERQLKMSDYNRRIRELYESNSAIKIVTAPLPLLYIRSLLCSLNPFYKTALIGAGGHVSKRDNPSEELFYETLEQLESWGECRGLCYHLFPIASGNMADGFLRAIKRLGLKSHRLAAITTGAAAGIPLLHLKYRSNPYIQLYRPAKLSYSEYLQRAKQFKTQYGIGLDPNHTIHLPELLQKVKASRSDRLIVWITAPHIESNSF